MCPKNRSMKLLTIKFTETRGKIKAKCNYNAFFEFDKMEKADYILSLSTSILKKSFETLCVLYISTHWLTKGSATLE
jgi:hypothetical protein